MISGHSSLRIDYILSIAEAIFLAFIAIGGWQASSVHQDDIQLMKFFSG